MNMKRLITICAITTICMVGSAQADLITFDFEDLDVGNTETDISTYMSGLYPGSVTVLYAVVSNTDSVGTIGGPLGPDNFIKNTSGTPAPGDDPPYNTGLFEISFDDTTPIYSAQFDAGVFGASQESTDFVMEAWDKYGNPVGMTDGGGYVGAFAEGISGNEWVFSTNWAVDVAVVSPLLIFDGPVTRLVFHDDNLYDVGIDNLVVNTVPVPGAVLLGILGLSVAGVKLRKYA